MSFKEGGGSWEGDWRVSLETGRKCSKRPAWGIGGHATARHGWTATGEHGRRSHVMGWQWRQPCIVVAWPHNRVGAEAAAPTFRPPDALDQEISSLR